MSKTDIPFLGTGWGFPPEFRKGKENIRMASGAEDIRESLFILLSTKYGERFMTPNFGCDLDSLLFESMSLGLEQRLEDEIRRSILMYETRINVEQIVFQYETNEGIIYIDIQYTIRTTNTRTNIVFPFYLTEGTNL